MRQGLRFTDVGFTTPATENRTECMPLDWVGNIENAPMKLTIQEMREQYFMVEGNGIRLAASQIPCAGFGVRAMADIKAGTVITEYEGWIVSDVHLEGYSKRSNEFRFAKSSHALQYNLRWFILGNYEAMELHPGESVPSGYEQTMCGIYKITKPELVMRGRGLGAYVNTLTEDDRKRDPTLDFNVAYMSLMDHTFAKIRSLSKTRFVSKYLMERPVSHIKVIVALRDIAAGEELFVDYNRRSRTSSGI